ncbi:MAG TPA: hypothetical protein VLM05_01670, partial [Mycobacteriales bacterium]|nr:hypothetical protein [Mycobacteriales bacterium]
KLSPASAGSWNLTVLHLGAPLARVELQASLATLLTDQPGLALAGEPERHPTFTHRGLATLPVTV